MVDPVEGASERERLADLLHDDVLQGVIAARWALDDIEADELPPSGSRALAEAKHALDRTQQKVREHVAHLRHPDAGVRTRATD